MSGPLLSARLRVSVPPALPPLGPALGRGRQRPPESELGAAVSARMAVWRASRGRARLEERYVGPARAGATDESRGARRLIAPQAEATRSVSNTSRSSVPGSATLRCRCDRRVCQLVSRCALPTERQAGKRMSSPSCPQARRSRAIWQRRDFCSAPRHSASSRVL